jgi:dimethylglycine dehydrogenase
MCNAMAKGARDLGATVVRHNRVLDIRARPSGEWEVITEKGSHRRGNRRQCRRLLCARSRQDGRRDAPITNMQHHYIVTHPIQAFADRSEEMPVMRDSYTAGYFRQEQKSGLIGVYENVGLQEAWAPKGYPAWESTNELFPDDLERISPWLERAIERMPIFGEAGIRRVINGAIPHTPDGGPLLGPAPGLKNFWMCCGTSFGIAQGGGCGKYLAQWMMHGDADINMTEFDPRRFGKYADEAYSRAKVYLDYKLTFVTRRPGEEDMDGRPQKTSPLHDKLKSKARAHRDLRLGASEMVLPRRPRRGLQLSPQQCLRGGSRRSRRRARARGPLGSDRLREIRHQRPGRGELPQSHLRQQDAAQGGRHRAGAYLLSPQGRILGEMTISRLGDDRFYALSAAAAEQRDLDLMQQSLLPGEKVTITNVTEQYGVIVLSGPRSRDVLSALTDADLGNDQPSRGCVPAKSPSRVNPCARCA